MAVEVLIRRKIMETKAKEVAPLIVKLRSLATIQPGYISGETLNCIDPPSRNEYLVRSTWHSAADWKKWLHSKERVAVNDQIEQLSREKAEYEIYQPLVGGIIPASNIEEKT
ncbi:MAG: antibiotic biosynthesis monooxygenase [Desulfobacterales bacterium]|jgi:heme-degrading monooxygenase HmoA